MNPSGIIVIDVEPLFYLVQLKALYRMMDFGIPLYISDMVMHSLRNTSKNEHRSLVLAFIEKHLTSKSNIEIKTGVPEIIDKLKLLNINPDEEAVRRILDQFYDLSEVNKTRYMVLVMDYKRTMHIQESLGLKAVQAHDMMSELENLQQT